MIDMHCHVLPGIDDGAANLEQSLVLARHAVADGITHMVCTPHIQPGTYDNNRVTITAAFECLTAALIQHEIPLQVAMAAEVRLCPEILPMLSRGDVPLYRAEDGQQTILLELPHSHVPPGTEKMLSWLMQQGINVLIAHPERNKEIMRNYDRAQVFVDMGCQLQLTSGSVSGRFGQPPLLAARYLLEQGWVRVLASDAHNLQSRPPELRDGFKAVASMLGAQLADQLVRLNPGLMVGGMFQHA